MLPHGETEVYMSLNYRNRILKYFLLKRLIKNHKGVFIVKLLITSVSLRHQPCLPGYLLQSGLVSRFLNCLVSLFQDESQGLFFSFEHSCYIFLPFILKKLSQPVKMNEPSDKQGIH